VVEVREKPLPASPLQNTSVYADRTYEPVRYAARLVITIVRDVIVMTGRNRDWDVRS